MNKAIEELIIKRCEAAKLEDDEYLECERGNHEVEEVQSLAEIACYKKGLRDAKSFYRLLECSEKM
ncbi:MAG: hypothetical protein K0R78_3731 [Pelosinus sp.]|nr:hypothetical protein [Pelosinus sp.]